MATIQNYLTQSELSQAAYADLMIGALDTPAQQQLLRDTGMTTKQAEAFASTYTVIDRKFDGTGLSVTLFQKSGTNEQFVAVRGTEVSDIMDIATDYFSIALLGTTAHQSQYAALSGYVHGWLAGPELSPGFTVSGHSLGGFLATGLTAEFSASISHTYLYNTPGLGGITTGAPLIEILQALLVPPTTVDANKITNIKSDAWISPIAGLGDQVVEPTWVHTENQLLGVSEWPASLNHSVQALTDALAIYDVFSQVDSTLTVETIGTIIKASSNSNDNQLESSLAALGNVFGKTYPVTETTREALYQNIYDLQATITSGQSIDVLGTTAADGIFTPFSATKIADLARGNVAYRYALTEGNAFAVLGASYSNQLNDLTDEYLADRAAYVHELMKANVWDSNSSGLSTQFDDFSTGTTLNEIGPFSPAAHKVIFGTDGNEDYGLDVTPLAGTNNADRIYGMGGNDVLRGNGGNDYLEGGVGGDKLIGGAGNDTLNGGTGFDIYQYQMGDGNDTIRDAEGKGLIKILDADGNVAAVSKGEFSRNDPASTSWTSADNNLVLTQQGTSWSLLLSDGSTMALADGFNDGDFGIKLVDSFAPDPDAPAQTTNDIYGDPLIHTATLAPGDAMGADWKEVSRSSSVDAAGNPVDTIEYYLVDANGYPTEGLQTPREDTIVDTAANDKVMSGEMNDTITLSGGGDNIVDAGAGDDTLIGGIGKDTLQGGAGFDSYQAGDGDVIEDVDGSGTVELGGLILTSATRKGSEPFFVSADGLTKYKENSNGSIDVWVEGANGVEHIVIKPAATRHRLETETSIETGIPGMGITLTTEKDGVSSDTNSGYGDAQDWVPIIRRDPLTLDLNGNGLETVAPQIPPILFDHQANGLKQSTGWVAPNDGFLVLDRNGNGTIDSGAELFGDSTPLASGGNAIDGFDALAQEDTNADGVVNSLDTNWANLRVWQDKNQDGRSQANEITYSIFMRYECMNLLAGFCSDQSWGKGPYDIQKSIRAYTAY